MKINEFESIDMIDGGIDEAKLIDQICENDDLEVPIYLCNINSIVHKYKAWMSQIGNGRVIPHYAVKCNDHPLVLKILANLGTSFDCASKGEINKILNLGIHPSRIVFANPTKPISHLCYALATNVKMMTFDSEIELHKIKKYYPNAQLILRIRCEAKKAQCPLGQKYGCDPDFEGPMLLKVAAELNLNVIGISFHVGSGCEDFPIYRKAIAAAKELFNVGEKLNFNFDFLDIGGGFPGDKGTSLNEVASVINSALEDYFPDPSIRIISEPGRYFVSAAFTLICSVHSKREIINPETGDIDHAMYFINDGVYGSFNCKLYDHKIVTPIIYKNANNTPLMKSSIWGPTCDGLDQVCDNVMLPKIDIGDVILFENMGAYTIPIASPFNGYPLPKVRFVIENGPLGRWLLKDANDIVVDQQNHVAANSFNNHQEGISLNNNARIIF